MTSGNSALLAQRLVEAREGAGLSIRQLAARAGTSYVYLSRLESGERTNPAAQLLVKIADVTGTDPAKFLECIGIDPSSLLPAPRDYFLRKMGVSENEADLLAGLVEYQLQKREEEKREDPG